MLLHYLRKLKIQFSADIPQIWKKKQTNCILSSPINTHLPWYLTDSSVGLQLILLTQNQIINCLSVLCSAGTVQSAAAWPPVNCACVPQLFQQLINITLCPAFLRKFGCQRLCCVPFKYKLFLSKSCPRRWIPCWLLTNTAVTSAVTIFLWHRLIAQLNK